jgi:hypothetical protein
MKRNAGIHICSHEHMTSPALWNLTPCRLVQVRRNIVPQSSEDAGSMFLRNLTIYETARSHIPKDNILHTHCREKPNLKSLRLERYVRKN